MILQFPDDADHARGGTPATAQSAAFQLVGQADSYVATGHIRTARQHPDGVVVVFRDGIVTAGPWPAVCRAYRQPMRRVFNRRELDLLVNTGGVEAATQVANMQFDDTVAL